MSTKNCSVTPGYQYTYDANDEFEITLERENMGFTPVVTVNLTDAIDTEDILAEAVTPGKLDDEVADAIPVGVATVANSVAKANPILVQLQLKDVQGNSLLERVAVRWWLSDADIAAADIPPTATIPDHAIVYTQGKYAVNIANSTIALGVTDSLGRLYLTFQHDAGALTRYFYAMVGDKLVEGSQALVWTA